MGGRRDDDGPGRGSLPAVPPPSAAPHPRPTPRPADQAPPPADPPPRPADPPRAARSRGAAEPSGRTRQAWLAVGLVLAAVATAAVFLTDNPLVLRVVLLGVCWAFVLVAFLGGSRSTDQVAAAAREAELRAAYDLELEREVAARHAHEAELESRLRRESEEAMRGELQQLRSQLAGLDHLHDDLAAVGRLRGDLDALGQLSAQLSGLAELRGELAGLAQLRAELAGVGELRAELGRLRAEVVEQLSGEVLVERMVMRAQSVRGPAQGADAFGGRTLDGVPDWPAEQPLSAGGWDVDSWTTTRVEPGAAAEDADPAPRPVVPPPPVPPAAPRRSAFAEDEQALGHRPPTSLGWPVGDPVPAPATDPALRVWPGEQASPGDDAPTGELPVVEPDRPSATAWSHAPVVEEPDRPSATTWSPAPVPPRHHRRAAEPDEDDLVSWTDRLRGRTADGTPATDDAFPPSSEPLPYQPPSYQPPSYEPSSHERRPAWDAPRPDAADLSYESPSWARDGGPATGSTAVRPGAAADEDHREVPEQGAPPETAGHARLEQILAESGLAAPSGGRSGRRRYRGENQDDEDDVLARVLGRD